MRMGPEGFGCVTSQMMMADAGGALFFFFPGKEVSIRSPVLESLSL